MAFSLRNKLLIVSLAPIALALGLGVFLLREEVLERQKMLEAEANLQAIRALSVVLSGLQAERGTAYLYLSGAAAADGIMSTRYQTDEAAESARGTFSTEGLDDSVVTAMEESLANLSSVRRQIDERSIKGRAAYTVYCNLTEALLDLVARLARTESATASRQMESIVLFERTKEYAGRAQCLASSIYSLDKPITYQELVEITDTSATITVNIQNASTGLGNDARVALSELELHQGWHELQQAVMNITASASTGGYGQDGIAFYSSTNSVSALIQKVIDLIAIEGDEWFQDSVAGLTREMVLVSAITGSSMLFV
ncbi:MAG: nitrate- and nitrite sensing domain-containing protein, partial [Spirochaetales bacterium]|nr:nitrate- and nitrite sensing domain-containing protein [Spirochaetales bacterium]